MRIAVITGASSGLGQEFARQMDLTEKNIDEFWLIARRQDRLEQLANCLQHPCRVLAMDLTDDFTYECLENLLTDDIRVGVFINCAGYAKIGNYEKVSRFDSDNIIDLNCKAAVNMTLTLLPYMKKGDRIAHVCSTAAFQPLQHLNLYAASKSFLYNYTRALRMELLPRGIMVTSICPWWIKDTEFISVASDNAANSDIESSIRHFPFPNTETGVVKRALGDSRIGLSVSTPGIVCTLHRIFCKLLPRKWMLYFWELLRRI